MKGRYKSHRNQQYGHQDYKNTKACPLGVTPWGSYHFHGKPEILVGKSNDSRHSVWEASENMDCDLRRCQPSL